MSRGHEALYAQLREAGHNVWLWRDDPCGLLAYAQATGWIKPVPRERAIAEQHTVPNLRQAEQPPGTDSVWMRDPETARMICIPGNEPLPGEEVVQHTWRYDEATNEYVRLS